MGFTFNKNNSNPDWAQLIKAFINIEQAQKKEKLDIFKYTAVK